MTGLDQLVGGFAVALSWKGIAYCFIGCLWGTVVGVLPGLGPLAGMTLLLPLTFGLEPAIGIIMLTGIFYGAMYGGSTTSILVRIPGEAASVITCIDGYEMARSGRQLRRRNSVDRRPDADYAAARPGHDRDRPVGPGRAAAPGAQRHRGGV